MDALEVHECFRVWWSYARTSYIMFDVAVMGVEASDLGRAQSATAASLFLASMADSIDVDCPRDEPALGIGPRLHRGGGSSLA